MSSEEEDNIHIFRMELTLSEYVPQDKGFYFIFQRGEVIRGTDDLLKVIAVIFNELQSYLDRRITNISDVGEIDEGEDESDD